MGDMDFRDRLAGALHELHLVLISIEDWLLIQRESFDIHIDEEPYHALQIYANLAKKKYVIRVWGTSAKSGGFSTVEELASLCASNFGRRVSCLGYLGADPGGIALVQVRHPCPRWISKSCAVTFDKNQSGLIVGLCSACSGESVKRGINHLAEEVPLRRKSSASYESSRSSSRSRLKQGQHQKSANDSEDHYPDPDPIDSLDWPETEKRKVEDTNQRGEPRQERKRLKPEVHVKKEDGGSPTCGKAEKIKQEKEDKKADLQTCDKCGKVLKGIDTLRYHIKAIHENLREWKCDEPGCDKAFVESHQLDKHRQAKHGGGVVCDICGKQLATQVCLKQHVRTIHKRQGLSLKCKYCDERFHCPSAKNTHTYLVHFPDKYKCHICQRSTSGPSRLKRHMETHMGAKFKCAICGNGYMYKDGLEVHMRTHTGEKPVKCPYCPWSGISSSMLNKHKKREHKNERDKERDEKTQYRTVADQNDS